MKNTPVRSPAPGRRSCFSPSLFLLLLPVINGNSVPDQRAVSFVTTTLTHLLLRITCRVSQLLKRVGPISCFALQARSVRELWRCYGGTQTWHDKRTIKAKRKERRREKKRKKKKEVGVVRSLLLLHFSGRDAGVSLSAWVYGEATRAS